MFQLSMTILQGRYSNEHRLFLTYSKMTTHEIEKVNCLIGYLEFFVKKGRLIPQELAQVLEEANEWVRDESKGKPFSSESNEGMRESIAELAEFLLHNFLNNPDYSDLMPPEGESAVKFSMRLLEHLKGDNIALLKILK